MKNYHELMEEIKQAIDEAPVMMQSPTTMFGFSPRNFEMKIRQLIQKMGFEKGINRMEITPNGKMMLYFANAAKARDFVITFNGLVRGIAKKGSAQAAQLASSFDKSKAMGSAALVTIDFNLMKEEVNVQEMIETLIEAA